MILCMELRMLTSDILSFVTFQYWKEFIWQCSFFFSWGSIGKQNWEKCYQEQKCYQENKSIPYYIDVPVTKPCQWWDDEMEHKEIRSINNEAHRMDVRKFYKPLVPYQSIRWSPDDQISNPNYLSICNITLIRKYIQCKYTVCHKKRLNTFRFIFCYPGMIVIQGEINLVCLTGEAFLIISQIFAVFDTERNSVVSLSSGRLQLIKLRGASDSTRPHCHKEGVKSAVIPMLAQQTAAGSGLLLDMAGMVLTLKWDCRILLVWNSKKIKI